MVGVTAPASIEMSMTVPDSALAEGVLPEACAEAEGAAEEELLVDAGGEPHPATMATTAPMITLTFRKTLLVLIDGLSLRMAGIYEAFTFVALRRQPRLYRSGRAQLGVPFSAVAE